jgi:hypothetical protein
LREGRLTIENLVLWEVQLTSMTLEVQRVIQYFVILTRSLSRRKVCTNKYSMLWEQKHMRILVTLVECPCVAMVYIKLDFIR